MRNCLLTLILTLAITTLAPILGQVYDTPPKRTNSNHAEHSGIIDPTSGKGGRGRTSRGQLPTRTVGNVIKLQGRKGRKPFVETRQETRKTKHNKKIRVI